MYKAGLTGSNCHQSVQGTQCDGLAYTRKANAVPNNLPVFCHLAAGYCRAEGVWIADWGLPAFLRHGLENHGDPMFDLVSRQDLRPPSRCNVLPTNGVGYPAANHIWKRFVGVVIRKVNILGKYSFHGIASFSQQKAAAGQDIKYPQGDCLALV